MTTTPQSKTIELETGLGYHYLEWDKAASTHTLVLVHGFLDFSGGWQATVNAGLYKDFHIVAPDMRGHGDSDRIGAGGYYHFFDYVADLRSFIGQVGRQRVSLVGHSMGGSIVSYYAGSFPDELAALVLMEGLGPPDDHTPPPDRVKHWVRHWKRAATRAPHLYKDIAEAATQLLSRDKRLGEELALDLATWGTRELTSGGRVFKHDPLHLSMGPIGFTTANAETFWKRITCPTLLIDGAESVLNHTPAERARRRACLKNPQLEVIEEAGHMMQRHQPAELSRILRKFLS